MSDVDLLESVLDKDVALVAGVSPDRHGDSTPCPDYDVKTLLDHMVGWLRAFAASVHERESGEDAGAYSTDDHEGEFRAAAKDLVEGWRARGTEGTARFATQEMPAEAVLGMTLMEYVTHGCDLAIATGQPVPFTDEELETTLARARVNLPDQYRGEGMPFGHAVPVPDGAPAVDRLLGFMGRQPVS
ncbi:MAG TPA: TIGR03086 family metal-binding protein [Mycobacteriales bacterium]